MNYVAIQYIQINVMQWLQRLLKRGANHMHVLILWSWIPIYKLQCYKQTMVDRIQTSYVVCKVYVLPQDNFFCILSFIFCSMSFWFHTNIWFGITFDGLPHIIK